MGGRRQQLVGDGGAHRRRDSHDVRRLRREALDPHHDDVSQNGRQGFGVAGCCQLLSKERVATRPRQHGVDEGPVGRTPDDVGEQTCDFDPIQPRQLDLRDAGVPAEFREEAAKRASSFDLVCTIGGNQHDSVVVKVAGQEVDHFDAGGVGPLEVFENEHDRGARR